MQFGPDGIRSVYNDILIAKLRPGQVKYILRKQVFTAEEILVPWLAEGSLLLRV